MGDGIEYYDVSGKTAPLVTVDSAAWTGSTAEMRRKTRIALFAMRGTAYENDDTGWSITIGRAAIDKTLSESGRPEHFQALECLPELLRNAVLVRKSQDRRERRHINSFYRLYAPIRIQGNVFAAQITIKEIDGNEKRFYLQRLEINKPAITRGVGDAQARPAALLSAGSPVSIPRLLRDVKSGDAPADESVDQIS